MYILIILKFEWPRNFFCFGKAFLSISLFSGQCFRDCMYVLASECFNFISDSEGVTPNFIAINDSPAISALLVFYIK